MTQTFWLTASVLILLALAFIIAPLIFHRSGRQAVLDLRNQNLLAYRSRLEELDQELEAGSLDRESYQQLREELQGSLLDDVPDADRGVLDSPSMVRSGRSGLLVVLASLIALPAAAVLLYERWGAMDQYDQFLAMKQVQESGEDPHGQMQGLAEQLRAKLLANPDNSEGWAMLGRTYMNLQQYGDAAWAFEQLAMSIEEEPLRKATAWGLSAQAQFFQSEGSLAGEAFEAIEKARALNPDEVNSLGLLGIVAFRQQNFEEALQYWERIVEVAPDHPQIGAIRQGIERAYEQLGQEPPESGVSQLSESREDASDLPGVAVRVELDAAFEDQVADSTPLFVFARSANQAGGPPLAVARLTAGQLPAVVRLDDRNAMSPQAKISDAQEVRVQARLSPSGTAMARPGDWEGQVDEPIAVQVGAADPVTLVIDTRLTN